MYNTCMFLQPAKVRQRFVVRPKTRKILCMKSIPGVVESSKDFVDSSIFSQSSQLMETSFSEPRQPDFTQSMYLSSSKRPNTAPHRRRTLGTDFMGSSPDLSIYSEPGPVELFTANRLHHQGKAGALGWCISDTCQIPLALGLVPFDH